MAQNETVSLTAFVGQPATAAYDANSPPTAQPRAADLDPTFLDAMTVRYKVFVVEQQIGLATELDNDDTRSCHWVAYADKAADSAAGTTAAASKQAIGTIRAVPYPQAPHPVVGGNYTIVNGVDTMTGRWVVTAAEGADPSAPPVLPTASTPPSQLTFVPAKEPAPGEGPRGEREPEPTPAGDRATSLHDGKEPYVKLGRIAVLAPYRSARIGRYLVQTTLDWIRTHPTYFDEHGAASAAAAATTKFSGLVCVHAQTHATGFYTRLGFVVDEGMGTWWEEGIPHVGMFLRLDLARA